MRALFYAFPAAALLVAPAAAFAQQSDTLSSPGLREVHGSFNPSGRRGFWLTVGLGVGGESFNANDGLGWSDTKTGGVGYLKLGGTINPHFQLGAELQGWSTNYYWDNYDRSLGSLMGIVQYYPSARGDFWIRGGFGYAHDRLRDYSTPGIVIISDEDGTAFAGGLGYDVRLSRRLFLTPSLDFMGQHYSDHDERLVTFGVGITFH
ncbi:MAG TPA: hypothetical protein VMG41_01015 [Gemmatimonadales bacterium]|nr:hypothetical protein [Gemmatimonadales bacterium]